MNTIEPDPQHTHSLEVVIRMTGSTRRKILFYCQKGVVKPVSHEKFSFDEMAVMRLRRIETLRQHHRMNWAAIRTIMRLQDELEDLREELRFRR